MICTVNPSFQFSNIAQTCKATQTTNRSNQNLQPTCFTQLSNVRFHYINICTRHLCQITIMLEHFNVSLWDLSYAICMQCSMSVAWGGEDKTSRTAYNGGRWTCRYSAKNDTGNRWMIPVFRRIKSVMLADIEDWHGQRLFIAATMDDAQYKAKLFDDDQKECAKAMHTEQVNGVIANRTPDNTMTTVPRNNNASFSMNCGNKAWYQLLSRFVMQPLIMTRPPGRYGCTQNSQRLHRVSAQWRGVVLTLPRVLTSKLWHENILAFQPRRSEYWFWFWTADLETTDLTGSTQFNFDRISWTLAKYQFLAVFT